MIQAPAEKPQALVGSLDEQMLAFIEINGVTDQHNGSTDDVSGTICPYVGGVIRRHGGSDHNIIDYGECDVAAQHDQIQHRAVLMVAGQTETDDDAIHSQEDKGDAIDGIRNFQIGEYLVYQLGIHVVL